MARILSTLQVAGGAGNLLLLTILLMPPFDRTCINLAGKGKGCLGERDTGSGTRETLDIIAWEKSSRKVVALVNFWPGQIWLVATTRGFLAPLNSMHPNG
jgi:hypothetical protein